jgi:hypothetical protein
LSGASLLALLTLIAYQPIVTKRGAYELLNVDDQRYLVGNPHVLGLTRENILWALTSLHQSNWHPLTWMSWQLDWQLHGLDPGAFHLTNVALHVTNVCLLFVAFYRLTGAWGRSVTVAGLFAVHPLHVESVAWVSERKDLLSTLFFVLTLIAYTTYARRPGWFSYVAVVVLLTLGLMSKAMLVTVPFVLLLVDFWPLGRFLRTANLPGRASPRRALLEKVPLLVLAGGCAGLTLRAQDRMIEALPPLPLLDRGLNALAYYGVYLARTVWPAHLVVYRPNPGAMPGWPAVAIGGALVIAVTVIAFRERTRRPYLLVGWLWYLGTLVPVIGLVQVGFLETADHYTYVPLIGVFIIVAWGGFAVCERLRLLRIAPSICAAFVLALSVLVTRHQVGYWRTSTTVWEHVVESFPRDAFAHAFLGRAFEAAGDEARAEAQYALARELDTTWPIHLRDGLALEASGDPAGSRRELEAVLLIYPRNATALRHLAALCQRRGDVRDAIRVYATLAQIEPRDADAELALGLLYERLGDATNATLHLRRSLDIDPKLVASEDALTRLASDQHL